MDLSARAALREAMFSPTSSGLGKVESALAAASSSASVFNSISSAFRTKASSTG